MVVPSFRASCSICARSPAWEEAIENLEGEFEELPSIPLPTRSVISLEAKGTQEGHGQTTEEEEGEEDGETSLNETGKRTGRPTRGQSKKTKLSQDGAKSTTTTTATGGGGGQDGFESIFEPEWLKQPELLTTEQMEKSLVERQKKMLLEEYGA